MKRPERIAGAIYDVDDTLLVSQPTENPLSNLHQVARLAALHTIVDKYDYCTQLRDVGPQKNFDSFAASPVHTIFGAFHTLLKTEAFSRARSTRCTHLSWSSLLLKMKSTV
ncbi:MAG TPA: hypothetical protein VLF64_02650, partial [Candidatus Saccharimonadales bacterium]|nr:hypothetical protein [Candidatus Saccharimonadales bacterium]